MPKFKCTYAYDLPCFVDFLVEAKSKKEADRIIKKVLRAGRFDTVEASPAYDNDPKRKRVWVSKEVPADYHETMLDDLTGYEHVFNPSTELCVRCGVFRGDAALSNKPCPVPPK